MEQRCRGTTAKDLALPILAKDMLMLPMIESFVVHHSVPSVADDLVSLGSKPAFNLSPVGGYMRMLL